MYTKEAETADQYIEDREEDRARSCGNRGNFGCAGAGDHPGQGARRMSAAGLREEVELAIREMRGEHLGKGGTLRTYLFDCLEEEAAGEIEKVRLGEKNGRHNKI